MKRLNKNAIDVNFKNHMKQCLQSLWRELSEQQTEKKILASTENTSVLPIVSDFFC